VKATHKNQNVTRPHASTCLNWVYFLLYRRRLWCICQHSNLIIHSALNISIYNSRLQVKTTVRKYPLAKQPDVIIFVIRTEERNMSFDAELYTGSVLAYSSCDGSTIYSNDYDGGELRPDESSSSFGRFMYDVRSSESKEEMLVLLANVSNHFGHEDRDRHDEEMLNGTAEHLAQSLHRLILLPHDGGDAVAGQTIQKYQQDKEERYRSKLGSTRELQATVIVTAIDLVLECSDGVLRQQCPTLYDDLAPSLPRLVTIIANQIHQDKKNRNRSSSTTVSRLVVLNNCIKIMRRVGRYMQDSVIAFICALLLLVEQQLPSDVRVDAACAVSSYVSLKDVDFARKDDLIQVVEENSSVLISIICTAAMANAHNAYQLSDCLDGLVGLARTSLTVRKKLLNRRCVILVIRANLMNADCQSKTLELCSALLTEGSKIKKRLEASPTPIFDNNLELLANALIKASLVECENEHAKITMITLLGVIINEKAFFVSSTQVRDVMTAMHNQAFGNNGAVAIHAAICYLEAVGRVVDGSSSKTQLESVLSNVIEYTTSPYAKIRAAAFDCLNDLSFWSVQAAQTITESKALLDNVSYIMTHGSNRDCSSAMYLCKQLLFHDRNRETFCKHESFLSCLARLVTNESITNRTAYINAVVILLDLMVNKETGQIPEEFEKFKRVLIPWLIKFANRTSNEDLKKRVVEAIIRFSSSLLQVTE